MMMPVRNTLRLITLALLFTLTTPAARAQVDIASVQVVGNGQSDFPDVLEDFDDFGHSVASLGDLDGDGVMDLAVGAPRDDDGAREAGAVYVLFLNRDGTVKAQQKINSTEGGLDAPDVRVGWSLAGLGDLDGDAIPDLAAGVPVGRKGAVYVLFLNRDGTVKAQQKINSRNGGFTDALSPRAGFGRAVAGLGDFDGDGVQDLAVSDARPGGAVFLLYLRPNGSVRAQQRFLSTDFPFGGSLASLQSGALAGIGNLDGAGALNLVIGVGRFSTDALWVVFFRDEASAPPPITSEDFPVVLASPTPFPAGQFGVSVAGTPDVDGDGVADLLVGAYGEDVGRLADAGRAYLFSGATGRLLRAFASLNLQLSGHFGQAVASTPDVDGDGVADLLIGAPGEYVRGLSQAGRVYLFSGSTGALLHTLESPNPESYGFFGREVAPGSDIDSDGVGELLVSAPYENAAGFNATGRVYLFSGATGRVLLQVAPPNADGGSAFGISAATVPDTDGDGVGELLVGAFDQDIPNVPAAVGQNAGRAYLLSGATGAPLLELASPNAKTGGRFGVSVAPVPDINGDGATDLLIGASDELVGEAGPAGRAYLLSGAMGELLLALESPNPKRKGLFGTPVAAVPDANGDDAADLLIGALSEDVGESEYAGRAYLFSGSTGQLLRTLTSPRPEDSGHFGGALASASDLDGDGAADFLVGASSEDVGGIRSAGRVYLFSGSEGDATPPSVEDATAPECELVKVEPGPPTTLRVRVRDGGSGLASITVKRDRNAVVDVPAFTPGVQTVLFVTAQKVDERKRASVVLEVRDVSGNVTTCDPVVTTVSSEVPEAFELGENYPNPFNPTTKIAFKLAEHSDVRLAVYDVVGREVATLVREVMEAGTYEVEWEGRDSAGRMLPSGVYLYRLTAGSFSESRTMTLLK